MNAVSVGTEDWQVQCFQSGTMIVANVAIPSIPFAYGMNPQVPWLYIYGPGELDEDCQKNRYQLCVDVATYLMGRGNRPRWLDDLRRVSEERAEDIDGTSIEATGPMVDKKPPCCIWYPDESYEAKNARARLMDRLFLEKYRDG